MADTAAVSQVVLAALHGTNSAHYSAAVIAQVAGSFTAQAIAQLMQRRTVMVAIDGDEVVGTASLEGDVVRTVFVAPARHGQGIGRALMSTLHDMARHAGLDVLKVPSTINAKGFYAGLGYRPVREVLHGEERTVVMEKHLGNDQRAS